MTMTIELTSNWSHDEMMSHADEITECFQAYVSRFPDETIDSMWRSVASGERILWAVKDETGKVIMAPIVEVNENSATGVRSVSFVECSGSRMIEGLELARTIEDWAWNEIGADHITWWAARPALVRLVSQRLGYEPHVMLLRKKRPVEEDRVEPVGTCEAVA